MSMVRMSGADILKRAKKPATLARLKRLAAIPDSAIDYSDVPRMTQEQLGRMVRLREYLDVRHKKVAVAYCVACSPLLSAANRKDWDSTNS